MVPGTYKGEVDRKKQEWETKRKELRETAEANRQKWEDKMEEQRNLKEFDEFVEELRMQQMGFPPAQISDTRLLVTK